MIFPVIGFALFMGVVGFVIVASMNENEREYREMEQRLKDLADANVEEAKNIVARTK